VSGRGAAFRRNDAIIREADKIIAFWNGKSTGIKYVIDNTRKLGKPVEIIMIKENRIICRCTAEYLSL
jgi:hypothetical protein